MKDDLSDLGLRITIDVDSSELEASISRTVEALEQLEAAWANFPSGIRKELAPVTITLRADGSQECVDVFGAVRNDVTS